MHVNVHKSAQFTLSQDYFRLVKWSPDGLCFVSSSSDCKLRLFDLPANNEDASAVTPTVECLPPTTDESVIDEPKDNASNLAEISCLKESLSIKHPDPLYDLSWYPHMSSNDPATCVFAISSANSPIHLYDAYTGSIRGTYKPIDHLEQMHSANSVSFTPTGDKIYSGFRKGLLRIFDISVPGTTCDVVSTYRMYYLCSSALLYNTRVHLLFLSVTAQGGILSCITFNSFPSNVCAIASFDKTISLLDPVDNSAISVLQGHRNGVTHLNFSPDGNVLYSGARKDSEILAWDLRNLGTVLASYKRTCDTNQTIYFGEFLSYFSGESV